MYYPFGKKHKNINKLFEHTKVLILYFICCIIICCAFHNIQKNEKAILSLVMQGNFLMQKILKNDIPAYRQSLLKEEVNLKTALGSNFAESLNYLHHIKNIPYDWTSALPIFAPPYSVRKAGANSFLQENLHHYSSYNGAPDLRKAISKRFQKDGLPNIKEENIIVHTSVFEIIEGIYASLNWNSAHSILVPTPTFGYYASQASKHNIKVNFITATQKMGWKIQPRDLDEALTLTKAKVFLFTNPVNPTGVIYTRKEVEQLASVLKKHSVLVISDEIFKDMLLTEEQKPYSIGAVEGMENLTVTLNGLGKSMGLAGLRISFGYVPEWLNNILPKPLCGLSKPAEKAATTALQDNDENRNYLKYTARTYRERVNLIKGFLSSIDQELSRKFAPGNYQKGSFARLYVDPKATNVALLCFSGLKGRSFGRGKIETSLQLASYLAKEAGVALVLGEASFIEGNEMVLRIPLAASNLQEGFKKIKQALLKLNI